MQKAREPLQACSILLLFANVKHFLQPLARA